MSTRSAKPSSPRAGATDASRSDPLADILRPGQSIPLLQELHILTRDGKLNQDSRRKLKQVHHLVQFIEPLIEDVWRQSDETHRLTLVDHGAGKSYLGFILRDLCLADEQAGERRGRPVQLYGIENRPELVEKSKALAQRLGFPEMLFLPLSVAEAINTPQLPQRVDIVTALHACDTATDDAIRFALNKSARHIVLVPCCQAEVASVLRQTKAQALARDAFSELWRHPHHTREFGSQLTNVLRCLQLEAHGYQVTVTELTGWEHAMKNELILATYKNLPRQRARKRLHEILQDIGLAQLGSRFFTEEDEADTPLA